jgi:hypothetical protein
MTVSTLTVVPEAHASGTAPCAEPTLTLAVTSAVAPALWRRPRLLDLCCGAGGASAGYHAAGFDVTGVDIESQPDYPFPFIRADALTIDLDGFDVIAASPPCQRWSTATPPERRGDHPDLVAPIRARLIEAVSAPGGPSVYVIENVPGAPLRDPVSVCGDALRLGVRRHRLFESNVSLVGAPCWHDRPAPPVAVYGTYNQRGRRRHHPPAGPTPSTDDARAAMGIDWMPWPALTQAIPPAYTYWFGVQLIASGHVRLADPDDQVQVGSVTDAAVQTSHLVDGETSLRSDPRRRGSVTVADGFRHCRCPSKPPHSDDEQQEGQPTPGCPRSDPHRQRRQPAPTSSSKVHGNTRLPPSRLPRPARHAGPAIMTAIGDSRHVRPTYHQLAAFQPATLRDYVALRTGQPDYHEWLDHVAPAAACTRPIRLSGDLFAVRGDGNGGAMVVGHTPTDHLPDEVIYKACGNRRASICPACARTYQRDAYQVLHTMLVGGKGVPASVAVHPAAFVTFTAPSFGTVHNRTVKRHTCANRRRCDCRPEPCHPRRDAGLCDHGLPAVCWARHESIDAALGRPLCLDCYDHDHQVVWNLYAAELWRRTTIAIDRHLARLCRQRRISFHTVVTAAGKVRHIPPVRITCGKVAEYQSRGAVHFHALIRLDGVNLDDPTAAVPPPPGLSVVDLDDAVNAAAAATDFATPEHPDRRDGWPIVWGDEGRGHYADVKHITMTGRGDIGDSMVAGYLAKYATKSTEATGHRSTRINADTVDVYADPDGDHIARLIDACWRLGRPVRTPELLAPRQHPPRPNDWPQTPWTCETCGTRTYLALCPNCIPNCQPDVDTEPTDETEPNPYARLRRWAHMLGFGGHFLTKARRHPVTFTLLRTARVAYRRTDTTGPTPAIRTAEHLDEETTLVVGILTYAGSGWHTIGDAALANTAAAMARARKDAAREELAHEIGASRTLGVAA